MKIYEIKKSIIELQKNRKNIEKSIDIEKWMLYNGKACKISDEVGCGYNPWNSRVGGNSYGVCRGLDQAVSY